MTKPPAGSASTSTEPGANEDRTTAGTPTEVEGAVRSSPASEYSPDQDFALAYIRVANQHRGLEPFTVARAKGWGRERFETVKVEIDQIDLERWREVNREVDE